VETAKSSLEGSEGRRNTEAARVAEAGGRRRGCDSQEEGAADKRQGASRQEPKHTITY